MSLEWRKLPKGKTPERLKELYRCADLKYSAAERDALYLADVYEHVKALKRMFKQHYLLFLFEGKVLPFFPDGNFTDEEFEKIYQEIVYQSWTTATDGTYSGCVEYVCEKTHPGFRVFAIVKNIDTWLECDYASKD